MADSFRTAGAARQASVLHRVESKLVGSSMGTSKGGGHFCPPGRWEEKEMSFALLLSPRIGKWTEMSTPLILPATFSYTLLHEFSQRMPPDQ
jgi:hypothetical protein